MTRPVVTIASHATRASGSFARMASRMASEIWSASLSGWPSVTDSDVNSEGTALVSFESPAPARTRPAARSQAPGFSSGAQMLTERQVVDAGVPEQLRPAAAEQVGGRGPRGLHDGLDVVAAHDPRRGRCGDRAEHDRPRTLAQALVVAEHLVVEGELERARYQLGDAVRGRFVLTAGHEADGEHLLRSIGDGDVEGRVVDDASVHVLSLIDAHRAEQSRDGG